MAGIIVLSKNQIDTISAAADGTTDDTAQIQSALNLASTRGSGRVILPPGTYATTSRLTLPQHVELCGMTWRDGLTSVIKPKSGFSSTSVLFLDDPSVAGYSGFNTAKVTGLTIDGSASGGTVAGMLVQGKVAGFSMSEVRIQSMTGAGFVSQASLGNSPVSHNIYNCTIYQCAGNGMTFSTGTDSTIADIYVLGCTGHAYQLTNMANSTFMGCRAEWSGGQGFYITGAWNTGTGSGAAQFIGCSTDRNDKNGVLIDSTGNGTLQFSGLQCRRDGRNAASGGGSYAAIRVNTASTPVIVNGMTCYPGVDDDGTGTNSPQFGINSNNATYFTVTNGYVHAATTAVNNGGSNTLFTVSQIGSATGTTSSPTRVNADLSVRGHSLGMATPAEHSFIAWTYDPSFVRTSFQVTGGTIYLAGMYVNDYRIVSKIFWYLDTAGVSPTASQNFVALLDSTGTVLQTTNVDSSVTATSGSLITTTITNQAVAPGLYWAAFLFNAGTEPKIGISGDQASGLSNANLATASLRYATNGTTQTSITNRTPASNTGSAHTIWAALG